MIYIVLAVFFAIEIVKIATGYDLLSLSVFDILALCLTSHDLYLVLTTWTSSFSSCILVLSTENNLTQFRYSKIRQIGCQ